MPDYNSVRDYDTLFRHLDTNFNKLLGIKTAYSEGKESNSVLVKQLRDFAGRIEEFDRNSDLKQVQSLDMEFLRLRGLYNNAHRVIIARGDLARKIKRLLLDGDEGNFYGARLELHIAAQLVKQNIQFEMPDPPDFRTTQDDIVIAMECTSKHLVRPINELADIQRKVEDTIRDKANKPYCDLNCALIIDITNLQAHGTDAGHLLESRTSFTDLVERVQHTLPNRFGAIIGTTWNYQPSAYIAWKVLRIFGSIIDMTWYYQPKISMLTSSFVRYDEPDAAKSLFAFLNRIFPAGEQVIAVHDAIVPART